MYSKLEYDPNNPLPVIVSETGLEDTDLERYLDAETFSTPCLSYANDSRSQVWRERAVIVIFNVSLRENFGPFVSYLAMNYFDRYVSCSNNPLPMLMRSRQNDLELLCVCCLTLACKMMDKDFSTLEFKDRQSELKPVEPEMFLTMELHILKELKWNLRPVTPLCFVRFFAPEIPSKYGIRQKSINKIIMNSQNDISKTRFRPCVIAASALLAASFFLYPENYQQYADRFASKEIFDKVELLNCTKALIEMSKRLNLVMESRVAENEFFPRRTVLAQAGGSDDSGESSWRSPRGTGEESSGTRRPGKEKVDEDEDDVAVVSTMSRGDSEAAQMHFLLRWELGEDNRDDFTIFLNFMDPRTPPPAGPEASPPPRELVRVPVSNKLHEICDCCCFCCCPCLNPF